MKIFLLTALFILFISAYSSSADNDEWGKRYDAITKEVCENIAGECIVQYSAYPVDKDELPVNNLSVVAIKGKVVIVAKHEAFWGKGKDFRSKTLENPTWLDLALEANKMILTTGDKHHRYLDNFDILYEKGGIKYIELYMGS